LTPMAIVSALTIALFTPAFPARVMSFPFVIAFGVAVPFLPIPVAIATAAVAYFARYSIALLCVIAAILCVAQAVRPVRRLVYVWAIALLAMWPWSGIVARAVPKFLVASPQPPTQQAVWVALERSQSVSIDAPQHKHAVGITASGAN